jgi:DENN (AEX-3) domain/uDENN domain
MHLTTSSSSAESRSSQSTTPRTPLSLPTTPTKGTKTTADQDTSNLKPLPSPPPTRTALPPSPATSSTPSKLRRKVSVEENLERDVSIQRLVEYFFVVSCRPRFDSNDVARDQQQPQQKRSLSQMPESPDPSRPPPISRRVTSATTPVKTTQEIRLDDGETKFSKPMTPKQSTPTKKRGIGLFKKRERVGTDEKDGLQEDVTEVGSSEYSLPTPQPRDTWKREEAKEQPFSSLSDGHEDNIHLPQASERDIHTFEPKVTARFPLEDHRDNPFNPMLTHFCFPGGDFIFPSKEYHMPSVHHFVLTNDKGRKVYGTCLTVYEEYVPPENTFWKSRERLHRATVGESGIEVSVNPQYTKLYIPRVLCILSIWPYVKAFREYLAQLYRLATSTNCMEAPIERYVINICNEIPAPPPGAFEVHLSILDSVIRFWSPPARLPIAYVALPYEALFDCLDIDNILHLWYCLTMERKVLLVSRQHSILTVCAEILCSLLYPMKWSHLYVPMLPQFLCPMLDAPGTSMSCPSVLLR